MKKQYIYVQVNRKISVLNITENVWVSRFTTRLHTNTRGDAKPTEIHAGTWMSGRVPHTLLCFGCQRSPQTRDDAVGAREHPPAPLRVQSKVAQRFVNDGKLPQDALPEHFHDVLRESDMVRRPNVTQRQVPHSQLDGASFADRQTLITERALH